MAKTSRAQIEARQRRQEREARREARREAKADKRTAAAQTEESPP